MPYPINPAHRLQLENGSYLLLEDNTSKFILNEVVILDDPLDAASFADTTPTVTFAGDTPNSTDVTDYEVQIDTVNTFDSQAGISGTVDSYATSNSDNDMGVGAPGVGQPVGVGQSFTGDGRAIISAQFYMYKAIGTLSGNVQARIYAHTGTFGGSGGIPTGSALAVSDNFDLSTLGSSISLITFNFSGANQITLTNGTHYYVTFEWGSGDGSNYIKMGRDISSPSHAGRMATLSGGSWSSTVDYDVIFSVNATATPATPLLDVNSNNDIGFIDDTAGETSDPKLLLETSNGGGSLQLENGSYLILNETYPTGDYASYTVQSALAANTYYWRVRKKWLTSGQSATVSQTYNTNGSFTAPLGVTSVTVEVWAGGGGGGGDAANNAGGGGGGGQYAKSVLTVTPGTTYTVNVGAGGAFGTSATAGGDSWFNTNSTILAKGGGAGASSGSGNAAGGSGTVAGSIGDLTHTGGAGGAGDWSASDAGAGGGGAGSTGNGGAGASHQGSGAGGGAGGTGGGGAGGGGGTIGTVPGGGGGGGDGIGFAAKGA